MTQIEQAYEKIANEVASSNLRTHEDLMRYQTLTEEQQFVQNLEWQFGMFFKALEQQLEQREPHCLTHPA